MRRRKVSEERDGRDAGMNKKEEKRKKRGGQEKRPDRGSLHLPGGGGRDGKGGGTKTRCGGWHTNRVIFPASDR